MNRLLQPFIKPPCPSQSLKASTVKLPYFDYLLELLESDNVSVRQSFGRHVHWGYWEKPELAELTTADFALAAENLSEQVCQAAKIHSGLSILDVGCGFGGTIAHINDHYSAMKLVGLNLDERQLLRAKKTITPAPGNDLLFHVGNACTLPFPDQSFDVILAVECIFHFPDRAQFFKEAHRVLKPGGYLALSDFLPAPLFYLAVPKRLVSGFYGECNLQYTTQDYRMLARETHFAVQTERNITANTLPTYRYLRKLGRQIKAAPKIAILETAAIEGFSRLGLIDYYIYGFTKNERHSVQP